jgi:ABC-2 type transport system permease protein
MSQVDHIDAPVDTTPVGSGGSRHGQRSYPGAAWRQYAAEVRLVFGRRRNAILLLGIALVPILVGVAIRVNGGASGDDGPRFINQISENGLFLVFTSLTLMLPLLVPLVIGIVSGDTIAGESGAGTLRYLLTVPVSRARVLVVKGAAAFSFAIAAVCVIGVVSLVAGISLFPIGDVTLLSGDQVGFGNGLLRAALVAGYVVLSLTGLVTIGLLCSTLTEVPVAAMATTIVVAVISQVVDAIPQLRVVHPYLLTHHWLDFGELLRIEPRASLLLTGLAVQACYVAVAASFAWAKFANADVTA